jgi:ubiquinone/menaquinone biosynthesis C-methylase UbiE
MGYRFIDYLGWDRFKPRVDTVVLRRMGVLSQDKSAVILELFCGKGELQEIVRESGYTRVFGSDISESELRHTGQPQRLQACDSMYTCYKPEAFDFVFVNEGLHHLLGLADMKRCFCEINRILKPGGTFVFYEPADTPVRRFLSLILFSPLINITSRTKRIRDELVKELSEYRFWLRNTSSVLRLLEDAGFRIEKNRKTLMHMVVTAKKWTPHT